ncbi:uncharacterized protein SPAR_E01610 [Saccharomyces paradoxus]|uniref:Uncharacterized protein n=1 Tax=Saccharomyces paradoxus TaxID=27291 RepID=A0A8B8UQ68_SACPA|nr:uncharacterized protein SPAR_E01610 [Saccharomyces paradoxus]QHS72872.1 hypothetical protein SPAR_E01610 [Saccharomyces paradoxus]
MLNPNSRGSFSEFPTGSSANPRIKLKPSTLRAPPLTVSSAFSASNSPSAPTTVADKAVTPTVSKQY